MSKLFIPVGLPGCGKSTLSHLLPAKVISTDAIRERLTGDARVQTSNDAVFDEYHSTIDDCLGYDNIYADATNLRDFAREKLRKLAHHNNAETHVLVFTNMAQAIERNLKRDRVVPADVMMRFIGQFEQALCDIPNEKYNTVTYIGGLA